jgi:hypothetical protein
MMYVLLIGIGAGAVAALMFAALASGSLLAMALFYLAPLPILIAALGWSHAAGIAAALTGSAALFASFNSVFALAFMIGIGLPAWWLGYLSLLARPAATNGSEQLEWYPVGRLVFWAALLGGLIVMAAIPQFGSDAESFRAALKSGFERVFKVRSGAPANEPLKLPGVSDPNLVFELFAVIIPPAAAALTTATLLFNLWLAGRVVNLSGRRRRPWPDLSALALPAYAAAILAFAVAGSFLPGLIGIVAGLFAASLGVAYVALGLAVLHALTDHLKSRAIVLTGVYAAILLFGWPLLAIALFGLADALLDLRRRARKRGPPPGPIV